MSINLDLFGNNSHPLIFLAIIVVIYMFMQKNPFGFSATGTSTTQGAGGWMSTLNKCYSFTQGATTVLYSFQTQDLKTGSVSMTINGSAPIMVPFTMQVQGNTATLVLVGNITQTIVRSDSSPNVQISDNKGTSGVLVPATGCPRS